MSRKLIGLLVGGCVALVPSVVACAGGEAGSGDGDGAGDGDGGGDGESFWTSLPGGDGPQAQRRQEICEAKCTLDGMCDLWDAQSCLDRCDDPRELCQADLMSADCFGRYEAWIECQLSLTCEELEQFHFNASAPGRPCQAELAAYDEGGTCPYITTGHYAECIEQDLFCDDREMRLSPYWICDGEEDCADGKDEADCPFLTNE